MANQTWTIVPLPVAQHVVSSKWVYKIKFSADGIIGRYKVWLVAKGYTQKQGFNYQETFNPVAKYATVRTILALAAINVWSLSQLNVNNAFLNGELEETVYMEIPDGFQLQGELVAAIEAAQPSGNNSKLVCKLQKSLYGLKQASRQWNAKLTECLTKHGYSQSKADYSLFTKQDTLGFIAILVYVDDILIASSCDVLEKQLKQLLASSFKLKDLGSLKYFIELEIARSNSGISVSQRKYTLDLLEEYGFLGVKPNSIPIEVNQRLMHQEENLLNDPTIYRQQIGKLMYLTITRPDISYSVHVLS